MIVAPVFTAFLFALLITLIFAFLLKRRGPWGIWIFFLIVFMVMWAGGLWLYPIGPNFQGVAWVPLLVIGSFIALIFIAVDDHARRSGPEPTDIDHEEDRPLTVNEKQRRDAALTSIVFWMIMILLVTAVITGYFINQNV